MADPHNISPKTPVLGIESSCDETGVAIVTADGHILATRLYSQMGEHAAFGGVVPEIAARAHLQRLDPMIEAALDDTGLAGHDLGGIAAAAGPGLIGGLMVGTMAGKTMAALYDKPFIAVNHLEAHILTPGLASRMEGKKDEPALPYLCLLVSGGHSQLLLVRGLGAYTLLGTTRDDALGEAFDKCARMLDLPYPGGPELEKAAARCADSHEAARRFELPRPMIQHKSLDFSFSGLKTAMRDHINNLERLTADDVADLAASFQQAIVDILTTRIRQAISTCMQSNVPEHMPKSVVVCGGVGANTAVRDALADCAGEYGLACHLPPLDLCADNGAMIAWTGASYLAAGHSDSLDIAPRPRWPVAA